MNVKGINGSGTGLQSFGMNRNQGTDSVSKNLQNQIANAQKQMQELGDNKEMSLEEKMKKRQEIQQQISDLQNQLRQHQIEKARKTGRKRVLPWTICSEVTDRQRNRPREVRECLMRA